MAFTEDVKEQTYELYTKLVIQHNILDNPSCIWNLDEKSQRLQHKPDKVVARKGQQIDANISGSRESFTVVLVCNAAGKLLPPCFIISGKTSRSLNKWDTNSFDEAYWTFNETGYSTNETQVQILTDYVIPNIGSERPQLLTSDGFGSHEFLEAVETMIESQIHLFAFASHTTSKIQPVDKYINAHWNRAWNNLCSYWYAENPLGEIDHRTCTKLLKETWQHISPANVVASWR